MGPTRTGAAPRAQGSHAPGVRQPFGRARLGPRRVRFEPRRGVCSPPPSPAPSRQHERRSAHPILRRDVSSPCSPSEPPTAWRARPRCSVPPIGVAPHRALSMAPAGQRVEPCPVVAWCGLSLPAAGGRIGWTGGEGCGCTDTLAHWQSPSLVGQSSSWLTPVSACASCRSEVGSVRRWPRIVPGGAAARFSLACGRAARPVGTPHAYRPPGASASATRPRGVSAGAPTGPAGGRRQPYRARPEVACMAAPRGPSRLPLQIPRWRGGARGGRVAPGGRAPPRGKPRPHTTKS